MPPHPTPARDMLPHTMLARLTAALWAFAWTFVWACDSNPTPHPQQPDTTQEVHNPNDREPSSPEGDALGTETDDAHPDFEDFTNCDAQNETTDTDGGPNDFDRTDNEPCYPCTGESDGFSNGPPTGPR